MFFTQEDYRKIEKWLLANSRKDTNLVGAATPLKGNETVVLVQDGKNVKTSVKDIVDQFFLLGVSDFLNITDKYSESYISLTQAIQLIPFRSRKVGQVITFIDESGNWAIYQFQGKALNQWNNTTLWIDLLAKISGIPIIDSEDIITKVDNANQVSLYLSDKQYNEADYSGLGRIYLRKNIQNIIDHSTGAVINVNLLTQSMLSKENIIYILQYDYNLNGNTVTIPEGCILDMRGGSVTNGTINCVDTIIISTDASKLDVTLTGTYRFDSEKLVTSNTEDINIIQSVDRKSHTISAMLADRDTTNGMGYVILRKDKSFEEQVTQENTIYEIRYDFNIAGQTITIPSNCIIELNGGSIENGIINYDYTIINGDISKLNVTNTGVFFTNSYVKHHSFIYANGLKEGVDNKSSNTSYLQNLIDTYDNVVIPTGKYYIGKIEIQYSSACNVLRGVSRKDTILYSEGIYLGKSGVETPPIGLSPQIRSLSLINDDSSNPRTAIEFWGYNVLLSDIYIENYEYGILKSRNNGEIITSQIEKIVIYNCTKGINLVPDSNFQNNNIYSINCVTIRDCFIVDCTIYGIRISGTSNTIDSCAIQGCMTNVIVAGTADNSNIPLFNYNSRIINSYFEAKYDVDTATYIGVDIDVQNINKEAIMGLAIRNNYHISVANGRNYYEVVHIYLGNNYSFFNYISDYADVDYYKKIGVYVPFDFLLNINNNKVEVLNQIRSIPAKQSSFGSVNLVKGHSYKVRYEALKKTGSIGAATAFTLSDGTGNFYNVVGNVDELNEFKYFSILIEVTASALYTIVPNAAEEFYVSSLEIIEVV